MNANFVCQNAPSSTNFLSTSSRKTSKFVMFVLALTALLCGLGVSLQAQTASWSGTTTAFGPTTGFTSAEGIFKDSAGNLFITAADSSTWHVYELTPNGSGGYNAPVQLPEGGGYGCASSVTACLRGVTRDSSGNLWVAAFALGKVYELTYSAGSFSAPVTITGPVASAPAPAGWVNPWGIVADNAGDVFVSDYSANAIAEITAGTAAWINTSSVSQPGGLAIDSTTADLYVLDGNLNRVTKLTATSSYATATAVSNSVSGGPGNLARDASGNLWVTDFNSNLIIEVTGSNHSTNLMWGTSLNGPVGIWPDADGTLHITNEWDGTLKQIATQQPDFGTLALSASPASQTLLFTVQGTTANIGAPSVVTQGATGLDFSNPNGWTCSAYYGNTQCTVPVNFKPTVPGPRSGAVVMVDNTGALLGEVLVSGTGTGPQITFSPGAGTATLGAVATPEKIAVDAAGDVFIVDNGTSSLYEIPKGGGLTQLVNGLSGPYGVAVDGAGNVFISLSGSGQIEELYAPSYSTSRFLGPTFDGPLGLAFDGSGNLYVAEAGNHNDIVRLSAASDYGDSVVYGSGTFGKPYAVAVDGSGNIWVADFGLSPINPSVTELSSAGTVLKTISSVNTPAGIAVDPAGDVYIADNGAGTITELTASSNYATAIPLATGLSEPAGVALDTAGNVYYSTNGSTNSVYEIDLADPPASLTFLSTAYQNTSTDSPKTVTVSNIGNASLTFSSVTATPASFTLGTASGDCTGAAVTSGASCALSISFTPQTVAASIIGSAT